MTTLESNNIILHVKHSKISMLTYYPTVLMDCTSLIPLRYLPLISNKEKIGNIVFTDIFLILV